MSEKALNKEQGEFRCLRIAALSFAMPAFCLRDSECDHPQRHRASNKMGEKCSVTSWIIPDHSRACFPE